MLLELIKPIKSYSNAFQVILINWIKRLRKEVIFTNNDSIIPIQELLNIAEAYQIPILYHYRDDQAQNVEHDGYNSNAQDTTWFQRICETWRSEYGVPILVYSQQDQGESSIAPSQTIRLQGFRQFLQQFKMKSYLEQLAVQCRETYPLDSYYFAYLFLCSSLRMHTPSRSINTWRNWHDPFNSVQAILVEDSF